MAAKYIARSSEIAARMIGGEMMIMSSSDSTFFTLNEVATAIWQAADGKTSLEDIVQNAVCREFDVTSDQARQDSELFVEELSRHGILLVSEQPIESAARQEPAR
jgi:hypothetical protein